MVYSGFAFYIHSTLGESVKLSLFGGPKFPDILGTTVLALFKLTVLGNFIFIFSFLTILVFNEELDFL
jgi:hypothetical protein